MQKKCDSSKTYRESLPMDVRNRYDQKISVIGLDPYEVAISEFDKDRTQWPDLNIVDVIHYLVYQQSAYTKEQLRNHKALEAFKLFQDGWIRDTLYKRVNDHHLLRAKVTHSMAIRNKLLDAWIIIGDEGSILSAHCTCMAGLGECCSHVAAVLFALETWTRVKTEISVTDTPAYWMFPTAARFEAPYKRVRDMDCSSANKKRKLSQAPVTSSSNIPNIPSPTKRQEDDFMAELQQVNRDASFLSVEKEFVDSFVPKSLLADWPIDMSSIFVKECDRNNIDDVVKLCADIDISVTKDQARFVESQTQSQSNSPFWQKYRNGRVTASKFYAATHTAIEKPSVSLLKAICGVTAKQLQTAAIEWGKKKEPVAKKKFASEMKEKHHNFHMVDSGLVLHEDYPEFGASPDGMVSCDCCGKGCLEVKCPYTAREMIQLNLTWLETGANKTKELSRNHPHYFQVQMQMHMTNTDYCDFYVWSPNDCHYERVVKDSDFWNKYSSKAKTFHAKCVMLPFLVVDCKRGLFKHC